MSKKVLVMMGGFSAEREVSLVSGAGVVEALQKIGYEVMAYDLKNVQDFIKVLTEQKPDVIFNALHGNWGEDGTIQGFLDLMQIPYTHSGVKASVLGMDKNITKKMAIEVGIKVAEGEKMTFAEFKKNGTKMLMPFVVKPVSDGSSVGVFIAHDEQDLDAINYQNNEDEILIERFIEGKELTVMCLEDRAYVVTEIRPSVDFYDYEAKYTDGVTRHILPAEIPDEVTAICLDYAEKLHKKLGCNTVSRCDFRYNPIDGVVLLEINTNPGLTPLSLVPEQARYVGISYEQVCAKLVENAKCRQLPLLS